MTPEILQLRDLFAAFALPGVVAAAGDVTHDEIASECYALADAMLNERLRTMDAGGEA